MSFRHYRTETPDDAIERLRLRIEESERYVQDENEASPISDEDKDALLEFSDELYLRNNEYSDHRHNKLLRHCVIMAEQVGSLADALEDRSAAQRIVRWINKEYENVETARDYRVALRQFGRRVDLEPDSYETDSIPDSIEWIKTSYPKNHDHKPKKKEMLKRDEVEAMIDATYNARDAALIALAFDAGPRGGELKSLTYGDITDHKYGYTVHVEGKKGGRDVLLIDSEPYVARWLAEHPSRERSDPLWCKLNSPNKISNTMFSKILNKAADRAGVEKPVTPTNFRKSSASFHASRNLSQATLEKRYGWVRGSKAAARYIRVFSSESDREIAKMHGVDVEEDEPEPTAPLVCDRCGEKTPRNEPTCVWCGKAQSVEAVNDLEKKAEEVRRQTLRFVSENPELPEQIEDARDLMQMMDAHPELQDDIQQFMDALETDDENLI
ncbi:tyrosine-type recombinase/integrase [Haloarchaeobius amylolyticus]|uniref:Tyrosine-type recombinase/integrase n=1 Tax=Haloarchaeobius amylolyticus TaxID=1198296 RepID=A0ABD6BKF5_9EURY